jgi:uncharacterized membrane protein
MKILGYILIVIGAIHATGSIVSQTPGKVVISVIIAGIGVALLAVAKKRATKSKKES